MGREETFTESDIRKALAAANIKEGWSPYEVELNMDYFIMKLYEYRRKRQGQQ